MVYLLFIVIGILLLIILALGWKILLLQKSIQEINTAFHARLSSDTNTLIDVSSRDPYLLKLASDINTQLRLLRAERHRFQQGDHELKEAITNLSHDLRTPLTAISGYLDLLDREEKSEAVQNYLFRIRDRVDTLTNLTEELLRYSVATSPKELNPERLNLVSALEESLISFYGAMKEKGIEPVIHLPEKPVWKTLDKTAINRVFSNIIGNALKYSDGDLSVLMEEDGTITFSNSASELGPIAVGRLFDRFFTVEDGRSSTGLGLAIAKALTTRMGGTIHADYRDGKIIICISI